MGGSSVRKPIGELEELGNFRNLKSGANARAYAHQQKRELVFLTMHVSHGQGSYARGVHVRNIAEVQNQGRRAVFTYNPLEVEEIAEHNRAVQTKDALAVAWAGEALDR